jgi:hypothetical protein
VRVAQSGEKRGRGPENAIDMSSSLMRRGAMYVPRRVLLIGVRLQRPQQRREETICRHCGPWMLSHASNDVVELRVLVLMSPLGSRGSRRKLGSCQPYEKGASAFPHSHDTTPLPQSVNSSSLHVQTHATPWMKMLPR